MSASKKKALFVSVCLLVLMVVVGRIIWVNSELPKDYPVERFEMGEWVNLEGAFFQHENESTDGYAVKIESAQLMSCGEYLSQYGQADITINDDLDSVNVAVLEYEIKNEGNTDGGILLYLHKLIPERKNASYECDMALWEASQPQLKGTMGFAVQEGTTFSLAVPFTLQNQPDYFDTYDKMRREPISDKTFELVLSNAPVQKTVHIAL